MTKTYKMFIRYWDRLVVEIKKTNDLYHYVGELYMTSIEHIDRVDYKELNSIDDCPIYEPCCKVCLTKCKKYLDEVEKNGKAKEEI